MIHDLCFDWRILLYAKESAGLLCAGDAFKKINGNLLKAAELTSSFPEHDSVVRAHPKHPFYHIPLQSLTTHMFPSTKLCEN